MQKQFILTGQPFPFMPTTKQILAAAAGIFALGTLTLIALIGVVFFALIILLSWCLTTALSFVQALGQHLTSIWTTGDSFTHMLLVMIIGYIVFRMVIPHIRTLVRKEVH